MTKRFILRISIVGALAGFAAASLSCVPQAERFEGELADRIEQGVRSGTGTFDHAAWDEIVRANSLDDGARFDYAALKPNEAALDAYLDAVAGADVASLSGPEIAALFINAYNAYTVRSVLNEVDANGAYRVESIRDISDVFGRAEHPVAGELLSLDDMEHRVLRPIFRDPRVHFAVNCASISCPPLPGSAFTGDALETQLEAATNKVLRNPEYVRVEDGTVVLTRILDWFGGDFTDPANHGAEASVATFAAKYNPDVRSFLDSQESEPDVRFLDYDWGLNRR